jgi:Domain of unknown function (DUF4258)
MLELTQHAEVRMQQRGITRSMLDSLLDYGAILHDHRGATIVYFDRKARTRLLQQSGGMAYRKLEKQLNTYAVVAATAQSSRWALAQAYLQNLSEMRTGVLEFEATASPADILLECAAPDCCVSTF